MNTPCLAEVTLLRERIADRAAHPFDLPFLADFDRLILRRRVTFFVGENGSGKSTLLEALALAVGFSALGGSRNFQASDHEGASSSRPLADALRLSWTRKCKHGFFLRGESFFHVATTLDELGMTEGYGGRSLHARSHGESFLDVFTHRFRPGGLFLLDEPESAVSPMRQLALMVRMRDLLDASPDTQFVIATHSPVLLAFPGAQVLSFDDDLAEIPWEEAGCVRMMRSFLADPARWLEALDDDAP